MELFIETVVIPGAPAGWGSPFPGEERRGAGFYGGLADRFQDGRRQRVEEVIGDGFPSATRDLAIGRQLGPSAYGTRAPEPRQPFRHRDG
jgi:hypothetical protein